MLQSHLFVEGRLGDESVVRTIMKEHLEVHGIYMENPIPLEFWNVEAPHDERFQVAYKVDKYTTEGAPVGFGVDQQRSSLTLHAGIHQDSALTLSESLQSAPLSDQCVE